MFFGATRGRSAPLSLLLRWRLADIVFISLCTSTPVAIATVMGERAQSGSEKSLVLFFFSLSSWYWHRSLSRLQWAEGVRCGCLQGGRVGDREDRTNDFDGIEKWCQPYTRNCFLLSADTTVTVLFLFKHLALLFSVTSLLAAPFALQMYSRKEIVKHKHFFRALNKEHCAVMPSVSRYELLKHKHFAS